MSAACGDTETGARPSFYSAVVGSASERLSIPRCRHHAPITLVRSPLPLSILDLCLLILDSRPTRRGQTVFRSVLLRVSLRRAGSPAPGRRNTANCRIARKRRGDSRQIRSTRLSRLPIAPGGRCRCGARRAPAAAGGRFRGIRDDFLPSTMAVKRHLYRLHRRDCCDPAFRQDRSPFRFNPSVLRRLVVSHPQIPDSRIVARAFPIRRFFNHTGGHSCNRSLQEHTEAFFRSWRAKHLDFARHFNVHVKLWGLGLVGEAARLHLAPLPQLFRGNLPTRLAPLHETCIDTSVANAAVRGNFPVDKAACSYSVLLNAFKAPGRGTLLAGDRAALFHPTTAHRFYRLWSTAPPARARENL